MVFFHKRHGLSSVWEPKRRAGLLPTKLTGPLRRQRLGFENSYKTAPKPTMVTRLFRHISGRKTGHSIPVCLISQESEKLMAYDVLSGKLRYLKGSHNTRLINFSSVCPPTLVTRGSRSVLSNLPAFVVRK